jgi:hypothetical protein
MSANTPSDLPVVSDRLAKNAMRHGSERLIEALLFSAAAVSVLTTIGIVYVLVSESIHFFQNVSIVDFLTDTQWTPLFDDAHFGIMVLDLRDPGFLCGRADACDPDGDDHRHLPVRVRQRQGARSRQAHPRTARRHSDHRLRLFRAADRDAASCRRSFPNCRASRCSPPVW